VVASPVLGFKGEPGRILRRSRTPRSSSSSAGAGAPRYATPTTSAGAADGLPTGGYLTVLDSWRRSAASAIVRTGPSPTVRCGRHWRRAVSTRRGGPTTSSCSARSPTWSARMIRVPSRSSARRGAGGRGAAGLRRGWPSLRL